LAGKAILKRGTKTIICRQFIIPHKNCNEVSLLELIIHIISYNIMLRDKLDIVTLFTDVDKVYPTDDKNT
jgi:hypothetical protein